jgi:hypothetical protein
MALPVQINADDLLKAYVLAGLRRIGISYAKAIMTPSINMALRCTATAMKRKHGQPAPIRQAQG